MSNSMSRLILSKDRLGKIEYGLALLHEAVNDCHTMKPEKGVWRIALLGVIRQINEARHEISAACNVPYFIDSPATNNVREPDPESPPDESNEAP